MRLAKTPVRVTLAVLRPLARRSTYQRLAFLLVGSALSFGFSWIGGIAGVVGFAGEGGTSMAVVQLFASLVLPLPVMIGVGLLRSTLVIQRSLARTLLGVSDADLPPVAAISWRHRWRSALFFCLHVLTGYAVAAGTIVLAVFAAFTAATYLHPEQGPDGAVPAGFRSSGPIMLLLGLVAVPYLAAGVGAVFTALATRLLGATQDERLADLHHRVRTLAERNRLARELHDSVGHALSIVTVQAHAAQRVLDRDPEVARAALAAIADSAGRALADLDNVLALLREEPAPAHAQSTLAHLEPLLADLGSAGVTVDLRCTGDLASVPAVVSREAYRIIQEGLTNVLRHAGPVPVELRVDNTGAGLAVQVSNTLPAAHNTPGGSSTPPANAAAAGGRGLTGIQERVALLGGSVSAGPRSDRWLLSVHVPLAPAPRQPVVQ